MCGILRISTFEIMSLVDIDNSTFFQIEMPLISLSVCQSFVTVMAKTLRALLHRSVKKPAFLSKETFSDFIIGCDVGCEFYLCVYSVVSNTSRPFAL